MSWKVQTLSLNICANELRYDRRYSRPTHADVAALLPGDVLHAGVVATLFCIHICDFVQMEKDDSCKGHTTPKSEMNRIFI
jgi:hypothetical protein